MAEIQRAERNGTATPTATIAIRFAFRPPSLHGCEECLSSPRPYFVVGQVQCHERVGSRTRGERRGEGRRAVVPDEIGAQVEQGKAVVRQWRGGGWG